MGGLISRLKCDVLDELPPKTRQKISIKVDKAKSQEIQSYLSIASSLNRGNDEDFSGSFKGLGNILKKLENKKVQANAMNNPKYKYFIENSTPLNLFQKAYKLSGTAKVNGVIEFCHSLLEQNLKFLVFGHHLAVLDQIEHNFKQKKVKFIRIDGSVSSEKRFEYVGN